MVVSRFAQVLDQSIMEREKEIVRAGGAVMLLRIEPARRDVGVPRQYYFTARCGRVGRPHPPKEGRGQAARRHCRRLKHPAPGQPRCRHRRLHCSWAHSLTSLARILGELCKRVLLVLLTLVWVGPYPGPSAKDRFAPTPGGCSPETFGTGDTVTGGYDSLGLDIRLLPINRRRNPWTGHHRNCVRSAKHSVWKCSGSTSPGRSKTRPLPGSPIPLPSTRCWSFATRT